MNQDSIEVLAIGSRVLIAEQELPARIIGVWIKMGNVVCYRCSWWDGRTRKEEWLEAGEVHAVGEVETLKIGFHRNVGRA